MTAANVNIWSGFAETLPAIPKTLRSKVRQKKFSALVIFCIAKKLNREQIVDDIMVPQSAFSTNFLMDVTRSPDENNNAAFLSSGVCVCVCVCVCVRACVCVCAFAFMCVYRLQPLWSWCCLYISVLSAVVTLHSAVTVAAYVIYVAYCMFYLPQCPQTFIYSWILVRLHWAGPLYDCNCQSFLCTGCKVNSTFREVMCC